MKKLLLVAAGLFSFSAHAEFWDGNRLLEKLTSSSYYEQGLGMGYIMGVADTTVNVLHCAPGNATAGQMQDMMLIALRSFPERRNKTADSLVIDTLKSAWPCAPKNNGGRSL